MGVCENFSTIINITALACICTEIPHAHPLLACGNVVVVLGFIKKFLHHVYNKPKIFLCWIRIGNRNILVLCLLRKYFARYYIENI